MKRWHFLAGAAILVITLLLAAGSMVYKYVIVPHYIEPFAKKFGEALQDDKLLDVLYEQANMLHGEGVLDDDIYADFISAYNKRNRNEDQLLQAVPSNDIDDEDEDGSKSSRIKKANYASARVGVDLIKTNDGDAGGRADRTYSSERNSNRPKAEDIVEAEKIRSGILEIGETPEPTENPLSDEEAAYKKLMSHMSSSEAARFMAIMSKLDRDILRSYYENTDIEGLKVYLREQLSEDEYKDIVDMGYKYMDLFI